MQPANILLALIASVGLTSAAAIPDSVEAALPDSVEAAIPDSVEAAPLGKRACYSTGMTYGPAKGDALAQARNVCNSYFKGTYRKGTVYVQCRNLPHGRHVSFSIGLTGPNAGATRNLGVNECIDGLSKEINGCSRGGKTTYGNWMYKSDPNSGSCK